MTPIVLSVLFLTGQKTLSIFTSSQFCKTDQDDKVSSRFWDYLLEEECEGIQATKIGYDAANGVRGLYATEPLQQGEYICDVPFVSTLLLDEDVVVESTEQHSPLNTIQPALKLLEMMNVLIEESTIVTIENLFDDHRLSSVPWNPYFGMLPRYDGDQFDETPDFWSPEEIEQLEVPSLVDRCLTLHTEINRRAKERNLDPIVLRYAHWIVQSRAFTTFKPVMTLTGKALLCRIVLIPFFDLLNHSNKPNAELQVIETKEYDESFYALAALSDIEEGDEITIQYGTGAETFLDIFCKYGFVVEAKDVPDELLEELRRVKFSTLEDAKREHDKMLPSRKDKMENIKAMCTRIQGS